MCRTHPRRPTGESIPGKPLIDEGRGRVRSKRNDVGVGGVQRRVRGGVERRRRCASGLKAAGGGGRRYTRSYGNRRERQTAKVLKDGRPTRGRGRMGTSANHVNAPHVERPRIAQVPPLPFRRGVVVVPRDAVAARPRRLLRVRHERRRERANEDERDYRRRDAVRQIIRLRGATRLVSSEAERSVIGG